MKFNKKIKSKLVVGLLSLALTLGSTWGTVFAKTVDLSGFKTYKDGYCTTYMSGNLKSNWNSVTFTGKTGGKYNGSKTPDKITHKDVIKTTGIGSLSVSGTTNSGSASVSVSGSTTVQSYPVKSTKMVTVYPTYTGAASLITFTVTVSANTTYKFGSTYIVVATGDSSITN